MSLAPALVAVLALVVGCRTPSRPVAASEFRTVTPTTAPGPARLGPEDRIRIDVVSRPELSTPPGGIALDERGALHLPLVGRVELGGLDVDGANAAIEAAYALYLRAPHVALSVAEWRSRAYHVLGHVREPGRKALVGRVTALEALSAGGAFMSGADRAHCFLVRPHPDGLEVHEFDGESPDARGLVEVAPGDIIVVRRTGNQDFQEDLLPVLSGLGLSALYVSGRPLAN